MGTLTPSGWFGPALHPGGLGWDEAVMIGIGVLFGISLALATGRKSRENPDDADEG